jgi:solute carrier family 25 phosphate transporter 23/24/25/41
MIMKSTDDEIVAKFQSIDGNKDGTISISEFQSYLLSQKMPVSQPFITELNESIDANKDGLISLSEFKSFYRKREEELITSYEILIQSAFSGEATKSNNRKLNAASLRQAFSYLDIKASDAEVRSFIANIDEDSDGSITFDEYRNMLLLLPVNNPRAAFDLFRSSFSAVDYGQSEYMPPIESSEQSTEAVGSTSTASTSTPLLSKNMKSLLAGGIAGIASRTGTAPIDRLKTIMQAGNPTLNPHPNLNGNPNPSRNPNPNPNLKPRWP